MANRYTTKPIIGKQNPEKLMTEPNLDLDFQT